MNIQTLTGLSGISLLFSVILLRVLLSLKVKQQTAYIGAIIIFAVSFIPIFGISGNYYIRGLCNDLSITTLILMTYYVISPHDSRSQSRPLLFLITITGLFFYPAALGFGPIDPYAWGFLNQNQGLFSPLILLIILAILMYIAFKKQYILLLLCLVLAPFAYQTGILESKNIWDYLLDPVIFFYALVVSAIHNPFRKNLRL